MKDNYAYSEPWHIQNSLFNPFQGFYVYSKILMYIQSHSQTQRGEASKYPDFGKKGPDCVHLWVQFLNVSFKM